MTVREKRQRRCPAATEGRTVESSTATLARKKKDKVVLERSLVEALDHGNALGLRRLAASKRRALASVREKREGRDVPVKTTERVFLRLAVLLDDVERRREVRDDDNLLLSLVVKSLEEGADDKELACGMTTCE